MLHYYRSRRHDSSMAHVPHSQSYQVARSRITVNARSCYTCSSKQGCAKLPRMQCEIATRAAALLSVDGEVIRQQYVFISKLDATDARSRARNQFAIQDGSGDCIAASRPAQW